MHFIDKQIGETPLHAIGRLRAEKGIPTEVPLSYAGRLDPMATGQLLILEGEECSNRSLYLASEKEYRVEVLLGAHSDTGDILGIVSGAPAQQVSFEEATAAATSLQGPYTAPYPLFSSRTVQGKPLFMWALEGKTAEIEIPLQTGTIHDMTINQAHYIGAWELEDAVMGKLAQLKLTDDPRKKLGQDFRIKDARESWQQLFRSGVDAFPLVTFTARVTSGTYMRTLADELAKKLGSRGLALSIHRTKIFLD